MGETNKLAELIALAREPSSARRRELLREVTDIFMSGAEHGPQEMKLFDSVLSKLAADMEEEVRAELSLRMAEAAAPPAGLIRSLAADSITVAQPVLSQSKALSEEDLMHVARSQGQAHLRAISERANLPETISDVIVERGDDDTLGVLARNETAVLSRRAAETLVDRAAQNPELQEAVVERRTLPVDLLNEMYFVVEQKLRARILERNSEIDPATLQAALAAGRNRLAAKDGALPPDYPEAEAAVRALRTRGVLNSSAVVALLRNGDRTKFLIALAESTGVDFHTARRIVERRDMDALAILCKAADFDRALFLTFAVLILDPNDAMSRAREYGKLYNELPKETALRTLRFWRIRRESGEAAAA